MSKGGLWTSSSLRMHSAAICISEGLSEIFRCLVEVIDQALVSLEQMLFGWSGKQQLQTAGVKQIRALQDPILAICQ